MPRQDYVQVTREDLEGWLNSLKWKWSRFTGKAGIYLIHFSPHVACKLSSTIGTRDDALGRGKASMNLALVSTDIPGKVLNHKAKDRKLFQRTKNWRKTWQEGLLHWENVFKKSPDFYNEVAQIENRDKYEQHWVNKIEQDPNWQNNPFLKSLHDRLESHGILTPKQKAAIEKTKGTDKEPPIEENNGLLWLEIARDLYRAARRQKHQFGMGLSQSLGNLFKAGRNPSEKQWRAFLNLLDQFDVDFDVKDVPSSIAPRRASIQRVAHRWLTSTRGVIPRGVPAGFRLVERKPRVGEQLSESSEWDDNGPTDNWLGGTSAFKTLEQCRKYGKWSRGYWIIIIKGSDVSYGSLPGEVIIKDAVVAKIVEQVI